MTPGKMPPFVTRPAPPGANVGYDLSLAGPYYQENVTMRVMVLPGERACLQATCDRYLNGPLGEKQFHPLGHHVLLVIVDMQNVYPADRNLGSMHEIDVALFVPVVRLDGLNTRIGAFIPYLFVNNDWALVTGRQVLGFFKDYGIQFSDKDTEGPDYAGMDDLDRVVAWIMPETGPTARLRRGRVISWERTGDGASAGKPFASVLEAYRTVLDHLMQGTAAEHEEAVRSAAATQLSVGDLPLEIPAYFLKQARWQVDSNLAMIQEVIQADGVVRLGDFESGAPLAGDWQVTVANPPSHPMASELGLAVDEPIPVELGIDLQLKLFTMDMARE